VDVDSEVSRTANTSVAEIFARQGEAYFRERETAALKAVLGRDEPLVISVGGGAVIEEGNREMLATAGTVVWLRGRPETLIKRVHGGTGRPLLVGATPAEKTETLRRIADERRPLYAGVADETVDVDGLSTRTVVDRVLQSAGLATPDREAQR
jgi:shikimate kinase